VLHSSTRRRAAAAIAGGAALLGSGLLSATAGAEPPVSPNVWIQCTGFSGPTATFPHPLEGCIARGEQGSGSGYTSRTAPGT
jgi:hypothetical protein